MSGIILVFFILAVLVFLVLLILGSRWWGGGWRRGGPPQPRPEDRPGAARELTDQVLERAAEKVAQTHKASTD